MAKYKVTYAANTKKGLYFTIVINENNPYWLNDYILLPFSEKTKIVLDRLELTYVGWT